jgi:predicted nucleotidyltransferase
MVAREEIQAFVNRIVQVFQPGKVILFGSYAYGSPTADSDVDLLVVMPHRGSSAAKATEIRLACPRQFPLDLLVRKPSELHRRLQMGDPFVKEVTTRGIVLHEAHN